VAVAAFLLLENRLKITKKVKKVLTKANACGMIYESPRGK